MKKIPTIFLRDFANDPKYVTREPNPECDWVFAGEGQPTRKVDGTCVMFDGERWWARREVKPNKKAPAGFREVEFDRQTMKTVGWEPIESSPFAKFHAEAVNYANDAEQPEGDVWRPGTYELVGPKINGNPEKVEQHELWWHGTEGMPDIRDFDGLAAYMQTTDAEGIVWHRPDGRMAKIKARDFRRVITEGAAE